jgi:hypothetical protein
MADHHVLRCRGGSAGERDPGGAGAAVEGAYDDRAEVGEGATSACGTIGTLTQVQ